MLSQVSEETLHEYCRIVPPCSRHVTDPGTKLASSMVGTRFGSPPRACFKRDTETILHRAREKRSQDNREDTDRTGMQRGILTDTQKNVTRG
jgi:hypothetical protein